MIYTKQINCNITLEMEESITKTGITKQKGRPRKIFELCTEGTKRKKIAEECKRKSFEESAGQLKKNSKLRVTVQLQKSLT